MFHMVKKVGFAAIAVSALAAAATHASAQELTKLKYLLHFAPSAIELPVYYAKEMGYFKDEGLDVEIMPGKSSQDSVNALVAGSAFIASAQGSSVIQGASKGLPVVMVASRYGLNPSGLFTDKSISSLAQMNGKQIAVPFSTLEKIVRYMIKSAGADPESNKYVLVPQLSAMVNTFAEDKVDSVITTVPFGKGIIGKRRDYNLFLLSDYGVTDPGYVYITSQKNLDENPKLIRAFLKAVYRGYANVDKDMEKAAEITAKALSGASVDFVKTYYARYAEFSCSKEQMGKARGYIPVKDLKKAIDLFVETGIIKNSVDANKLATNRFFEGPDAIADTARCGGS